MMTLDLQSRGFALTEALAAAIRREARRYAESFPGLTPQLQVRVFDINGERGGLDKGCLVKARAGRSIVVASDLDSDLYRAIPAAFARLARATRSQLDRRRGLRRVPPRALRPIPPSSPSQD